MLSYNSLPDFHRKHLGYFLLILFFTFPAMLGSCSFKQETDILVPVKFDNIPSELIMTGPRPQHIEIRIQGLKSAVDSIADLKPVCKIDLSGVKAGVHSFLISKKHVQLPEYIHITAISPASITIKIDRKFQKELPVIIAFSGKPPAGLSITDAKATPAFVIIQGPEKTLAPLQKIFTKPIDLNGVTESIKKEITLDLPEDLIAVPPSGVITGEILIKEKIVTRQFSNIPVAGKASQFTYSITPPAINIDVKGPANILNKIRTEKGLKPFIDISGLKPGVYVRRAVIRLPVNTTLVNVNPELFTIKINNQPKKADNEKPGKIDR